jgi:hypothetical protein
MFWFNIPENVPAEIHKFLEFEKQWLYSPWTLNKILLILTAPFSLYLLALSFWKKSVWMGLGVVILMATGKIIWSIQNAGDSGKSILIPAISGLIFCIVLIAFGFYKSNKKVK